MKGITLCADCAYYDLKKHKCNRGATVDPDISKGQDVRFYVDCPLPDVQEVSRGHWENITGMNNTVFCSECLAAANKELAMKYKGCPFCLARMDGGADNG